ncbi:hypothetical protein ACIQGZ_17030 [Streptomyces sp. NPDC092296]|uniref:hypothetical protein n=1 Tax=Streptomyces sp. NPDC092296 TaxID=3366012 RepID=UPI00381906B7
MAEITQTILLGDPRGRTGNCLQAAIAPLLDLPLDDVPHFAEREDWLDHLYSWSAQQGYAVDHRLSGDGVALGIAYGPSPRGVKHAVVIRGGAVAWDPHPSRAGLTEIHGVFAFIPLHGTVGLVVSMEMESTILDHLALLGAELAGRTSHRFGWPGQVTLHLRMTDAPPGAVEVRPVAYRHADGRVTVDRIDWIDGGGKLIEAERHPGRQSHDR